MLRSVVPPPSPEMILSTWTPSVAKKPFSIATAHGSVAVTRPYWLTAISAADDGADQQAASTANTTGNADRQRFMSFLPRVAAEYVTPADGTKPDGDVARRRVGNAPIAPRRHRPRKRAIQYAVWPKLDAPLSRGMTARGFISHRLLGPPAQVVDQALLAHRPPSQ